MAYPGHDLNFGPDYHPEALRPTPDRQDCAGRGAGRRWTRCRDRPITDMDAYRASCWNLCITLVSACAPSSRPPRLKGKHHFAEGEDERVLRAAQVVIEERFRPPDPDRPPAGHRTPSGKGQSADQARRRFRHRQSRVRRTLSRVLDGLPQADVASRRDTGHRQGGAAPQADRVIGDAARLGYADGLICGMTGQYSHHLGVISQIIGKRSG